MYAYLDCASYQTYLKDHINRYQEEIKDLESKADSKKRNTAIKNATQQLTSYQKRWQEFQKLQVKTDHLPLSSYLLSTTVMNCLVILEVIFKNTLSLGEQL